jgi:NAD(P)-dependent dehydrogenase (short-subunit alcohol dehydrogenase family)|eukprot:scaffold197_cov268-Chaetoceros_neogracile.AAC.10
MSGSGVSIITGGGSGLGRALAQRLVSRSQPVIIVGRRQGKLLETQELCANPSLVRIVVADVAQTEGHDAILGILKKNEKIRALVHNAAVLEPVGKLMDMDPEKWREHMQINLDGPLFLTKKLLPRLKPDNVDEERGGRVLHISSGAAHYPYRGWGAYCTSKAAFHMLYRSLAVELSPIGVAVGSARPGVVDTPMQDLIREKSELELPDVLRFRQLKEQGNLMDPKEVATFLDWLLNETDDVAFSEKEWDVRNSDRQMWENFL